ncbi:MAG: hypothetical protein IJV58_06130 [Oscillospiraceae bacterium]|nr:hypothetical protein [Oscillospiraceae bacterium]
MLMYRRAALAGILLIAGFMLTVAQITVHMKNGGYAETAIRQSQTIVTAGNAEGTIYDRHFRPMVNQTDAFYACVIPSQAAFDALWAHTEEITPLLEGMQTGRPFCVQIDTDSIDCPDVTVLSVPVHRTGKLLAQHVLGYTADGAGVTGLEADFDRILRGQADPASVTYTVDARGHVLLGEAPAVHPCSGSAAGVVTTLDTRIQEICEAQPIEKGAIVVMDVKSGDVLAMASFPAYDPDHLAQALDDPDSPLINRCLYAYSVGSIFKLVTCAAAYEQGKTHFRTVCTGKTEVSGQVFRCHDWRGHGELDMKHAMIYPCNAYFVDMSPFLDAGLMRETAQRLGYGTQIALSGSIVSSGGSLPSVQDLQLPAEMANFCLGQGLLTATPLQVTQMTCGIANDGDMPIARLIRGYTEDGQTVENEKSPMYAKALRRNEAYFLQDLMIAAINENENSKAVPETVFAAAKTSTAQTGRYNKEEIELCHGWITGYFPMEDPTYAVTVLAEDGGYGNDAAAPVFRAIADAVTALE